MTTNCPNCGGALARFDPACPYCGTLVESCVNVMLGKPLKLSYQAYGVDHIMTIVVSDIETEYTFEGTQPDYGYYPELDKKGFRLRTDPMMKVRMEAEVIPMPDKDGNYVMVAMSDNAKIRERAKGEANYEFREDRWE